MPSNGERKKARVPWRLGCKSAPWAVDGHPGTACFLVAEIRNRVVVVLVGQIRTVHDIEQRLADRLPRIIPIDFPLGTRPEHQDGSGRNLVILMNSLLRVDIRR